MDIYIELRDQARAKRDKAIDAANQQYRDTVSQICKLSHMIVQRGLKRPANQRALRLSGKIAFSELYLLEAVEVVLRDSQMTLTELTLEIQRRGNRSNDDPRKVAHAIRSAMLYHRAKYKRDRAGRWSMAIDPAKPAQAK